MEVTRSPTSRRKRKGSLTTNRFSPRRLNSATEKNVCHTPALCLSPRLQREGVIKRSTIYEEFKETVRINYVEHRNNIQHVQLETFFDSVPYLRFSGRGLHHGISKGPLYQVFDHFANFLEASAQCDGKSATFDEISTANNTISIQEMFHLCEHFGLISKDRILNQPEVKYIANAVLSATGATGTDMDLGAFVDFFARTALLIFSRTPLLEKYGPLSDVQKVKEFIKYLQLHDDHHCKMMIRTAKSEKEYNHDTSPFLMQDQWALSPLKQIEEGIFMQSNIHRGLIPENILKPLWDITHMPAQEHFKKYHGPFLDLATVKFPGEYVYKIRLLNKSSEPITPPIRFEGEALKYFEIRHERMKTIAPGLFFDINIKLKLIPLGEYFTSLSFIYHEEEIVSLPIYANIEEISNQSIYIQPKDALPSRSPIKSYKLLKYQKRFDSCTIRKTRDDMW